MYQIGRDLDEDEVIIHVCYDWTQVYKDFRRSTAGSKVGRSSWSTYKSSRIGM